MREVLILTFLISSANLVAQDLTNLEPERRRAATELLGEATVSVRKLPEYERSHFYQAIAMEQVFLNDFKQAARTAEEGYPFGSEVLCEIGHRMAGRSSADISITATYFGKKQGTHTYYACIAEKYLEMNRLAEAEEFSRKIDSPEVRADIESSILAFKATKGEWRQGYQEGSANKRKPDADFYFALDAKDFSSALALAGEDPTKVFSVRCAQAEQDAKNKNFEGARDKFKLALDSLAPKGQRSQEGMKYFVVAYEAQAGMFDEALALAQNISDEYAGPKAKLTISAFLAQQGNFERATAVAETIRLKAKSDSDNYDPSASYETDAWQLISRAQTNAGKPADALATLSRIHDRFGDLSGAVTFEKAYALSSMGKFDEAMKQLPKVEIGSFDDQKVQSFALVASAYCRNHAISECLAWAHGDGTSLARIATMIGAAQGLIREVKQENPVPIYVH